MGLNATVAVIWRPRPNMLPAFTAAQQWWASQGVETVFADAHGPRFSAAAARNEAMRVHGRPGRPLVIADADTHPQNLSSLEATIAACAADPEVVHLPYTECQIRRIGQGTPVARFPWSVGGIMVATPETWWKVGGQDERFIEWAPEDFAFAIAHRTIIRRDLVRTPGTIISYQHPPNPGKEKHVHPPIYAKYKEADGNSRKMRWVVKGGNSGPTT